MFPPQLPWMGRDWSIWEGWLALTNGGWRVLVSFISNTIANWTWHNSRPISIVYTHSIKKRLHLSPGCHSVSFCGSSPGWRFVICPLMLWVMMTWATGTPSSFTVPGGGAVPQEAAEIIPVSYANVHVQRFYRLKSQSGYIVGRNGSLYYIGRLYKQPYVLSICQWIGFPAIKIKILEEEMFGYTLH